MGGGPLGGGGGGKLFLNPLGGKKGGNFFFPLFLLVGSWKKKGPCKITCNLPVHGTENFRQFSTSFGLSAVLSLTTGARKLGPANINYFRLTFHKTI